MRTARLHYAKDRGQIYEKVGQAYRGDRVDVLEEQNGWYKVKTYDGKEAWASSSYISIVE